jgi:HK97 family phage prohead protease
MNPIQIRAAQNEENNTDMTVEGKAIVFNETTPLFNDGSTQYYEMIDSHALDGVDLSNVYLYYNHDNKAVARTKNNTLTLDVRPDGVYFTAVLANTTYGSDLYKLVQRDDVDKCSFAFTIADEDFDNVTNTFTVKKIDKLFEISLVDLPAYENTTVSARAEVDKLEKERQDKINYDQKRKALILKTLY